MKHTLTTILLTIAAFSIVVGQNNDKPSTRRNDKIAEQIKQMDRQWLIESYLPNDMSVFDRIVADDFMITRSKGKTFNKAQMRADIISSQFVPPPEATFKVDDSGVQVRVFKDVAISTGYIVEKYQDNGKLVSNRIYFTNTYLKRNGRWQVVASQFNHVPQSQ